MIDWAPVNAVDERRVRGPRMIWEGRVVRGVWEVIDEVGCLDVVECRAEGRGG